MLIFIPCTAHSRNPNCCCVALTLILLLAALPPSLNFLSITGDYSEGGILTGSYGYIGGHEGKSIYSWYIHEVYAFLSNFCQA